MDFKEGTFRGLKLLMNQKKCIWKDWFSIIKMERTNLCTKCMNGREGGSLKKILEGRKEGPTLVDNLWRVRVRRWRRSVEGKKKSRIVREP